MAGYGKSQFCSLEEKAGDIVLPGKQNWSPENLAEMKEWIYGFLKFEQDGQYQYIDVTAMPSDLMSNRDEKNSLVKRTNSQVIMSRRSLNIAIQGSGLMSRVEIHGSTETLFSPHTHAKITHGVCLHLSSSPETRHDLYSNHSGRSNFDITRHAPYLKSRSRPCFTWQNCLKYSSSGKEKYATL